MDAHCLISGPSNSHLCNLETYIENGPDYFLHKFYVLLLKKGVWIVKCDIET